MAINPAIQLLADKLDSEVGQYLEAYNAQETVVAPKLKAWKDELVAEDFSDFDGEYEGFTAETLDVVEEIARTHESPAQLLSLRLRLVDIIKVLDDNIAGLFHETLPKATQSAATMDLEAQHKSIKGMYDGLVAMAKTTDMIAREDIITLVHGYANIQATGNGGSAMKLTLPEPVKRTRKVTGANSNTTTIQLLIDDVPVDGENIGQQVGSAMGIGMDKFRKLLAELKIEDPFLFKSELSPWGLTFTTSDGVDHIIKCRRVKKTK